MSGFDPLAALEAHEARRDAVRYADPKPLCEACLRDGQHVKAGTVDPQGQAACGRHEMGLCQHCEDRMAVDYIPDGRYRGVERDHDGVIVGELREDLPVCRECLDVDRRAA